MKIEKIKSKIEALQAQGLKKSRQVAIFDHKEILQLTDGCYNFIESLTPHVKTIAIYCLTR